MWPDNRYVASDDGDVNTRDNFSIARHATRLRCRHLDGIADDAKFVFATDEALSRASRLL
jgi:hypothetical protein